MIALLVVSAFMVSCHSEPNPASDGRLVSVNVNYPRNSRALYASSTPTTDIEDLYWYYTAEKDDGSMFITGQQGQQKLIDKYMDPEKTRGLWLADLGLFSTGSWMFSFYGYYPVNDAPPSDLSEVDPAYQCVNLPVVVTEDTSITVTLEGGAGLEAAVLEFGTLFWQYEKASEQAGTELTLTIYDSDSGTVLATGTGIVDDNGSAVFDVVSYEPELSEGLHMLVFDVKSPAEDVGLTYVPVIASNGSAVHISGDIENLDELGNAYVGDTVIEHRKLSYAITSTNPSKDIEVTFHCSPDLTNRKTEVEFPRGTVHKTTDAGGNTTTSTLIFTVLENTAFQDAVAAFRLELVKTTTDSDGNLISEVNANDFSQFVEIETYIGSGLRNVTVKDRDGNVINGVEYKSSSGKIEFKTKKLTEFYVYGEVVFH